MLRKARIDAPGALHHIIVRGIERRKIFYDDNDRDNFLDRLGIILTDTKTPCFACETTGSPIKGRVKRKNTSPMKKIYFFRLTLDGFVKSPNKQADNVLKLNSSGFLRIHQFPATARPYFTTCPRPLFHFYRLSVSRY